MTFVKWFANNIILFLNRNAQLRLLIIKIAKTLGFYKIIKSMSHRVNRLAIRAGKDDEILQSKDIMLSPQAKRVYLLLRKKSETL